MVPETAVADLLLLLSLMILLAKFLEEIMSYKGYPPILGDILAGIILGPSVLGVLSEDVIEEFGLIKWIGIISLLFMAGLETRFETFIKSIKQSFLVALGGIVVSFALGYIGGLLIGFPSSESLFLGAILTATSVGLTVKTLADIGALGTRLSTVILGAAVLDDVGGLLVLGITTAIVVTGSTRIIDLAITASIAIVFYIAVVVSLHRTSRTIWRGITKIAHLEDTNIALLLALTLVIAWASVKVNLSLVVGAYAVGLAFSEISGVDRIVRRFSLIPNIFASIFFVISAATIDIKPYILNLQNLCIMAYIVGLSIIGKVLGCGIAARISGFDWKRALFIGFGMMPRAEVALIIASIGLAYKTISLTVFAGVILMIYVTSLSTPITLSTLWRKIKSRQ